MRTENARTVGLPQGTRIKLFQSSCLPGSGRNFRDAADGARTSTPVGSVRLRITVFTALLVCLAWSPARAQDAKLPACGEPAPKLIALEGTLGLDDKIKVSVENLVKWMKCGNDPWKLVPYINGRAIFKNYPESLELGSEIVPEDKPLVELQFHLRKTKDNRDVWVDLLAEAGVQRSVTFSVGLENQENRPLSRQIIFASKYNREHKATLIVIPPIWGALSLLVIVGTVVAFVWLARTTNLIRRPGPKPAGGGLRPYSLGLAQMAFWFLVILVGYLVLWLITDDLDTITPSLLALMGISAGTALGGAMIDADKASPKSDQESKGFIADILTETNGYALHRFQIFAWTIVLGVIFVSSIVDELVMPEFSTSLLTLMGISSGTYIGFRLPGQGKAAAPDSSG